MYPKPNVKPIRLLISLTLLGLLVLASRPGPADAAHSRRRPTRGYPAGRAQEDPSKYDRSITTFSSDGRLLQVEYGAIAAGRGSTVACLDLDCMEPKRGDTRMRGVVVAVVRPAGSSHSRSGTRRSSGTHTPPLLLSDKVHRIDHHAILVTSGLSGDSRALASSARTRCQQLRLSYGEAPTLREIANLVGSTQHALTRTAGARPFGVTAAVIGVDPVPDHNVIDANKDKSEEKMLLGTPMLYRTEPGGAVDRCDYCAAGKGADKVLSALEMVMNDDGTAEENDKAQEAEGIDCNKSQHMSNIIRKVALAALDADDDQSKFNTEQENENSEKAAESLVDIWLVEACSKRRGGTSFRVARTVKRKDLDDAASCLIRSDDFDRNER